MYIPNYFRQEDPEAIRQFIHANGFAILVSHLPEGQLWASHIPLVLGQNAQGEEVLWGHIARANPQWRGFEQFPEVMAIFNGPHAYVSSGWYDHENVPTWNYIAVHVYGQATILTGETLYATLSKTMHKYEAGRPQPVELENMNPQFVANQIRGIVGFEIAIKDIQAKAKLSQNRDEPNQERIIQALEAEDDPSATAIAKAMKHNQPTTS